MVPEGQASRVLVGSGLVEMSCYITVSESYDLTYGISFHFFPRCCDCDTLTGVCPCWGGSFLPGVTAFIWACLKYPAPMDLKEKLLVGSSLLLCGCWSGVSLLCSHLRFLGELQFRVVQSV